MLKHFFLFSLLLNEDILEELECDVEADAGLAKKALHKWFGISEDEFLSEEHVTRLAEETKVIAQEMLNECRKALQEYVQGS